MPQLSPPTRAQLIQRIYLRLSGQAVPVTDMTPIGAMRIFIEEAMIEEYLDLWANLVGELKKWFIVNGGTDTDLDRRLADYRFTRPQAVAATTKVRFVSADANAITILPGTVVRRKPLTLPGQDLQYTVQTNPAAGSDGAWVVPAGGTTDVPVVAVATGQLYNIPASQPDNSIIELVTSISNITVYNPIPIINGADAADDATAIEAFFEFLQRAGGNRAAIAAAIMAYVDPNTGARVHSLAFEEWKGNVLLSVAGRAVASIVYVEDGTGTATGDLTAALQTLLDGKDVRTSPGIRGAGLPIAIVTAQPFVVPVSVSVDLLPTVNPVEGQAAVAAAIQQFLGALPVAGNGVFRVQGEVIFDLLFKTVLDVPGVLRAVFAYPTINLQPPVGFKAMPGVVAVSAHTVQV